MAFQPVQFYELASTLYRDEPGNEAALRTVVSRAYYGAFLAARESASIRTTSGRVHEAVIQHFHTQGRMKVANRLGDLRTLRNEADYDLGVPVTSRQAGTALQRAQALLQDLQVLPPPTTPQKTDAR